MNPQEFEAWLDRLASGNGKHSKDHFSEFNNPSLGPPLNIGSRAELRPYLKSVLLDDNTLGFSQPNGQSYFYDKKYNVGISRDNRGGGTCFRCEARGDWLLHKVGAQEEKIGMPLDIKDGGIVRQYPELAPLAQKEEAPQLSPSAKAGGLQFYEDQPKQALPQPSQAVPEKSSGLQFYEDQLKQTPPRPSPSTPSKPGGLQFYEDMQPPSPDPTIKR